MFVKIMGVIALGGAYVAARFVQEAWILWRLHTGRLDLT